MALLYQQVTYTDKRFLVRSQLSTWFKQASTYSQRNYFSKDDTVELVKGIGRRYELSAATGLLLQ
jgi:hypothetical protein